MSVTAVIDRTCLEQISSKEDAHDLVECIRAQGSKAEDVATIILKSRAGKLVDTLEDLAAAGPREGFSQYRAKIEKQAAFAAPLAMLIETIDPGSDHARLFRKISDERISRAGSAEVFARLSLGKEGTFVDESGTTYAGLKIDEWSGSGNVVGAAYDMTADNKEHDLRAGERVVCVGNPSEFFYTFVPLVKGTGENYVADPDRAFGAYSGFGGGPPIPLLPLRS